MGVLRSGILGQIRGKVAGVVGGQWKDKNYLREYVKPANPNTAAQQAQRGKFALAVEFSKPLVGQVFNVYSDRFQKSMSGFNFFIKSNIAEFVDPVSFTDIAITEGKLFTPSISSLTLDAGSNEVTIKTSVSLGSNGATDDGVFGIAHNQSTGRWGFAEAEITRNQGSSGLIFPLVMSVGHTVVCYAWGIQRIGSSISSISDSSASEDAAE